MPMVETAWNRPNCGSAELMASKQWAVLAFGRDISSDSASGSCSGGFQNTSSVCMIINDDERLR